MVRIFKKENTRVQIKVPALPHSPLRINSIRYLYHGEPPPSIVENQVDVMSHWNARELSGHNKPLLIAG